MMNEEVKVLDEGELVEFIFTKLVAKGVVVTREDIKTILDLEMDYMVENGFAIEVDENADGHY